MKRSTYARSTDALAALMMLLALSWHLIANDGIGASLQIRLADGQTTFHVGEAISIELDFRASVPGVYEMSTRNYDRSGRLNMEQFHVSPAGRDPLQTYFEGSFFGGGLGSSRVLGGDAETMREELNEWVALDQPGRYTLYVTGGRVSRQGATKMEPVPLQSNSLEFDVVPADAGWQAGQLISAIAVLDDKVASRIKRQPPFVRSVF